jgi:hypothetical protein
MSPSESWRCCQSSCSVVVAIASVGDDGAAAEVAGEGKAWHDGWLVAATRHDGRRSCP